jgi:hypothetical protein
VPAVDVLFVAAASEIGVSAAAISETATTVDLFRPAILLVRTMALPGCPPSRTGTGREAGQAWERRTLRR